MLFPCGLRAAGNPFKEFSFIDLNITTTSGTLVLQSIDSTVAQVVNDGTTIEARDVKIEIPQVETNSVAQVSAPYCLYYFQAPPLNTEAGRDEAMRMQDELIETNQIATFGRDDMFLFDPEDKVPIKISLGTNREILCRNLYWSESAKRFISGGFFSQTIPLNGDVIQITGNGFMANSDFSSVEYTKPTKTIFSAKE